MKRAPARIEQSQPVCNARSYEINSPTEDHPRRSPHSTRIRTPSRSPARPGTIGALHMFGITDRRHFLKHTAGAAAVTLPGMEFLAKVRAAAPEMKKKQKSLIILWMAGGPPTIDMWDMKPDSNNGGPHKPKPTAASGIEISEHLPIVARQMKKLSIIRSLNSKEGDHNRGTQTMNTGRQPNPLLDYPALGSVLAYYQALDVEAMKNNDLPSFISVGGPRGGAGFLGMKYAPFNVQNAGTPPENVQSPVDDLRTARRAALFDRVEGGFKTNVPMDAARATRRSTRRP